MLYSVPGVVAFLLFYLYEIHTVTGRFSALKPSFFLGVLLIFFSTCAAGAAAFRAGETVVWRLLVFGTLAFLFLALLLYALFFAVPFSKTYVETTEKQPRRVCRTGMYALCRHPGVLWFVGFYLCLWLALGGVPLFSQFVVYSVLNLIYIVIQDRWSFLRCFEDYGDYKKSTPFLVPTPDSVRHCMATLKPVKGDARYDV